MDEHLAVCDAVQELEYTWGVPPSRRSIAERCGVSETRVGGLLDDLAEAGLVGKQRDEDLVWSVPGLPVLGEVG